MNKLSDDKVKILIELVRAKPGIFDKNDEFYKKFDWKEKAWKEIAKHLNENEKDCRVAWRSLRDQFLKSIKEPEGKKKYKYFHSLLFLSDCIGLRNFYNNYADVEALEEDPLIVLSAEEINFEPSISQTVITTVDEPQPISSSFSPVYMPESPSVSDMLSTPSKKVKIDDEDVVSILKKMSSQLSTKKSDGTDMFFASIASTVKNYNLSTSELALFQCEVLNFVTKRLEKIANNSSSKKETNHKKIFKTDDNEMSFYLS